MEDEVKRVRGKKKTLRVTFPSGDVVCYKSAITTMVAVLNTMGKDCFPLIKLEMCHLPLVAREIFPGFEKYMKPICEGWYLNTQSNTDIKFLQLQAISDQFGLGLQIELGVDFDTQEEPKKEKRAKHKGKLLVKMPNGEQIAKPSIVDTFLEVVQKLGIDNIRRKDLQWGGNPLITTSQMFKNQVQVDSNRWITIPNVTTDKVKLLRVIGSMLHVNMEVNILK